MISYWKAVFQDSETGFASIRIVYCAGLKGFNAFDKGVDQVESAKIRLAEVTEAMDFDDREIDSLDEALDALDDAIDIMTDSLEEEE